MVAEQFGEAIEMEAITRAAKYGRVTGKNNSWLLGGLTVDFQALVTVWSAPSWTASSGLSRTTWQGSRSCWDTFSTLSQPPLESETIQSTLPCLPTTSVNNFDYFIRIYQNNDMFCINM